MDWYEIAPFPQGLCDDYRRTNQTNNHGLALLNDINRAERRERWNKKRRGIPGVCVMAHEMWKS